DSHVLAHEMEKGISADQADLAISANGQFFTSGGEDHRLQAWNMAGSQSFTLEIPGQAIELLAISDNGRWLLAYLSGTSTLLLKDTRNDQDPINISTSNKPSSLIFLDQNRGFVVGSIAGDLTHYNLSGELVEILPVAEDEYTTLAWNTSKQFLTIGTISGTTTVLRLTEGGWEEPVVSYEHPDGHTIGHIALSSTGEFMSVTYPDHGIQLLRLIGADRVEGPKIIAGDIKIKGNFETATFLGDGQLVSFEPFEGVSKWDISNLLPQSSFISSDQEVIAAKGQNEIITGTYDLGLQSIDPTSDKIITSFGSEHQSSRISALAITSDRIISGDEDGRVLFFDASTKQIVNEFQPIHKEKIQRIELAKNGARAFSLGADKQLVQWNPINGQILGASLEGDVWDFDVSPNGNQLACISSKDQVTIYSISDGALSEIGSIQVPPSSVFEDLLSISYLSNNQLLLADPIGY
ncbi:MAG: WD40 repeat domain-containing protein, partial [Bacteroidota bacterium]